MFEKITDKISSSFKKLRGNNIITNENIKDSLKEIRMSLLEADVNYKVVKTLVEKIEEKALGQEVIKSISPSEQFIKIFNDELVKLLGEKTEPLNIKVSPPAVIMMAGLQGSGKTTTAAKLAKYLKEKENNEGVYVVPAFSGIGAPYWRPDARGVITGLTRNSDWKTLVRAVVESVAYQSYDLFDAMKKDGLNPKSIKVDGGMVANNWFAQFLSDIINLNVIRPKTLETTALGAAFLAGYQIGEFKSLNEIQVNWKKDRVFSPKLNKSLRNNLLQGWKQAIRKTLA